MSGLGSSMYVSHNSYRSLVRFSVLLSCNHIQLACLVHPSSQRRQQGRDGEEVRLNGRRVQDEVIDASK